MIKLLTTGCPKCIVLNKKLEDKNVEFEVVNYTSYEDLFKETGKMTAPILQVDNKYLEFGEAVRFVNSL